MQLVPPANARSRSPKAIVRHDATRFAVGDTVLWRAIEGQKIPATVQAIDVARGNIKLAAINNPIVHNKWIHPSEVQKAFWLEG